MRVGIVGCGPKGLFALERLLHHAGSVGAKLTIDVFEPHATPGAGAVYDPAQPDWLRMNLAAEHLNLWWPGDGAVPEAERRSFAQWRGPADTDPYPPRAKVGRYLAEGFTRVSRSAPPGVRLAVHRLAADELTRGPHGWRLTATDGSVWDHDAVLVTTGHPDIAAGAVFPVDRGLSPQRAPAGSTVAVRGFALTFIDAALTLTEGRGGEFVAEDHPYRLRYLASGAEPAAILPFSRTGRPMLAKPDAALAASLPELEGVADHGRATILALAPGSGCADLAACLAATTAAALALAGGDDEPISLEPVEELRRSLNVGAGLRAPDHAWALGHAWRALYPAIVERCSGDGLPDAEWPAFLRLAARMERIAFGPPPVNAAKLLALIEANVVALGQVRGTPAAAADVMIDAVLAPPGLAGAGSLHRRLVADGYARVRPGRRGVDVTDQATAVGPDGQPVGGLAFLGRATEDSIIGNDTLNRALHPHADRWAAGVAAEAAQREPVGTA